MKEIFAKSLLATTRDEFFGLSYTMNLYRGCQHGCIYCDSRSSCYQIADFSDIEVKVNAIDLLEKELASKKKRGTIGFGSMNDPYMPLEKTLELSRSALEVILRYRFPVHIITKSDLVLRDIDLLGEIAKIYCAVSFSFSTSLDAIAAKTEPGATLPSKRFCAIGNLRKLGIYCGITYMPVLPFISDTEKSVRALISQAHDAGACYILPFLGVTLREGSRDYFYEKLQLLNPALVEKYKQYFGNRYMCNSPREKDLYALFYEECEQRGIATTIDFYREDRGKQLALF